MSVLALKALGYGADRIPDKFWHNVPGGFFCPPDAKKSKNKKRNKSEQRNDDRGRNRSTRERSSPSAYSDYSENDSDYESDQRRRNRRRRAKSLGRSRSRSSSRGRSEERSGDLLNYQMERADRVERGPQFSLPPTSEYRPYDPRDYAPPSASPAGTSQAHYGYPPQVNIAFRSRSATSPSEYPPSPRPQLLRSAVGNKTSPSPRSRRATVPSERPSLIHPQLHESTMTSRTPSGHSLPIPPSPFLDTLRSGTPLNASFSPSYAPPLAAVLSRPILSRPASNPTQPSSTASRYTPGAGYTPSPAPMQAPMPPPNPTNTPYVPGVYVPAVSVAPASPNYRAHGIAYPSPPPFYRQESRSQPSVAQYPYPDSQMASYDAPDRHGSSASSRHRRYGDEKRHRARSAGHHRRSRSRVTDKVRDRFESLDVHDKGLAASMGGALAGGLVGRNLGRGTLSTLIGAGIGAFGAKEIEKRHDKDKSIRSKSRPRERSRGHRSGSKRDYSRSPSRDRDRRGRYEGDDSYSDSDSDRDARKRRGRSSRHDY
ncbi:hypothetical protein P280DRAFT_58482 [Massarina eburnea CBS 473.64]|uniref:Glycine zipper 2TM domain-containing protein n=1 Tax=Massarina eburnea CBS 473.64 TaxID=1395130 RepID=A0A6A6RUN6_9PLEO|nr:hypothetical protein P280DRAFT_58482 [Massarina eburnea CBS 473.64]